jgi:hypothetical protein
MESVTEVRRAKTEGSVEDVDRTSSRAAPSELLPPPLSSLSGPEVELAILWVQGLEDDRQASQETSRVEEQAMMRAGRARVAEMREEAGDQWHGSLARAAGSIVAGSLQVASAFSSGPGTKSGGATEAAGETASAAGDQATQVAQSTERQVDRAAVLMGGAKLVESTTGLIGAAYDRAASEHAAIAEEHHLDESIAERRADRAREDRSEANDAIERTMRLLSEMLAATNAAQRAAIRG